jgi:hypothetical protein
VDEKVIFWKACLINFIGTASARTSDPGASIGRVRGR